MDPNQQQPQYQPNPNPPQPQPQYTQQPYTPLPQQYAQPEQYSQYPDQVAEQHKPINFKLIGIFAGVFILLVSILTILIAITSGGTSLNLTNFSSDQTSFSANVPENWENKTYTVGDNYSLAVFVPPSRSDDNLSQIMISHDTSPIEQTFFTDNVNQQLEAVSSESYAQEKDATISNISSEPYGPDGTASLVHRYNLLSNETQTEYAIEEYYIYLDDGSTLIARFNYSQEYSDLHASVDEIVSSIQITNQTETTN